ncbi:hypothetical protein FACS1894181_16330 [Bacteroidia bacterium]|nr:hypothetical protein FACS1894181_16330 [Bacteroidia bacterium]
MNISWNAVSSATNYELYRNSSASGTYTYQNSTTNTDIFNAPLAGANYYKVKVSNGSKSSDSSAYAYYYYNSGGDGGGGSTTPPAAPTGVTARQSGEQIIVSWNAVSGATSYTVWYKTPSMSEDFVTTSNTSYSFTWNYPVSGVHTFKVYATNSNWVQSTTYGSASCNYTVGGGGSTTVSTPAGVTATQSGSFVLISWRSVSGATSYKVYRGSSAYGSYTSIGSTTSTSGYDNSPLNGYNYYKVTAVKGTTESDYSNYVSCYYSASGGGGGGTSQSPKQPNSFSVANVSGQGVRALLMY